MANQGRNDIETGTNDRLRDEGARQGQRGSQDERARERFFRRDAGGADRSVGREWDREYRDGAAGARGDVDDVGNLADRGMGRDPDMDMRYRGGERGPMRRWRRTSQCARDIMTRRPHAARPTDSIEQIAKIMVDEDTGIVPIVEDDDRLVGVVTDRDIVCRLIARGVDLKNCKARDAMTDDLECVTERETLADVLRIMSEHQVRRVPVVGRGDRLLGIISMADIAREADADEELQDTFEEISSERRFWTGLR